MTKCLESDPEKVVTQNLQVRARERETWAKVRGEKERDYLWVCKKGYYDPTLIFNLEGMIQLTTKQENYISVWLECEVKWALGSITMNKDNGVDGIPVELFQILKDGAVKVLRSIHQHIWRTQQWPQDWKRSIFIAIPKKGDPQKCSNYRTIALISHASKVMLKILHARL